MRTANSSDPSYQISISLKVTLLGSLTKMSECDSPAATRPHAWVRQRR